MNTKDVFYVTGGDLGPDAPSYVKRRADDELYRGLLDGEFCYVLNSRQMGKSSLKVRAAARLRAEGVAVAQLDLTAVGKNLTPEQWYDGLLFHLGKDIGLEDELDDFWRAHRDVSPLLRWMRALREVVLARCPGRVVIFVDEIDTALSLPFSTDEFFAAIRECYTRRAVDPEMSRLTFCLLGVATPTDLIRDARTTPFNIGRRIELHDFTEAECVSLREGLGRDDSTAARLLNRVLHWTGGHPYLTQSLCEALSKEREVAEAGGVDRLCERLFFSSRAREIDKNLGSIGGYLLREDVPRVEVLDLYDRLRRGRRIRADGSNPLAETVRLSGVARSDDGTLRVRNRIYAHVFDAKWVRENRPDAESRRRRRAFRQGAAVSAAMAVVVLAMLAGVGYFVADRYFLEHTVYSVTAARRFGVHEPRGIIDAETVRHRNNSLKFTRIGRNGPITRLEQVNGLGIRSPNSRMQMFLEAGLTPGVDTPKQVDCQDEFIRDADGRVVYEVARDRKGHILWGFVYSPADTGQRITPQVGPNAIVPGRPPDAIANFVDSSGFSRNPWNSRANHVAIWRDSRGHEEVFRFYDSEGQPRPNRAGIFGFKVEHDERGLGSKSTFLARDGSPMMMKYGFSQYLTRYDSQSRAIETTYLDLDGRLVPNKSTGYARETSTYDDYGNPALIEGWDPAGKPVAGKDGFAKTRFVNDDRGNAVEIAYLDSEGRPVANPDGIAKMTGRFDDQGNLVETRYFDVSGRPINDRTGFARRKFRFNDVGRIVEMVGFDGADKPVKGSDGYSKRVEAWDNLGNVVETAYFDESGKPTRTVAEPAKTTYRFDDRGHLVERAFFDESGKPTRDKDGVAKVKARFNEAGDEVETAYFDESDKPARNKAGYALVTFEHDAENRKTDIRYFDESRRLIRGRGGFNRVVRTRDDQGKTTESTEFGFDGSQGFSGRVNRLDDAGRLIEQAFLDESEKPIPSAAGYFKRATKYGPKGELIEERYLDLAGQPMTDREGVARVVFQYDNRGNQVEATWLDLAGSPIMNGQGFARVTMGYNPKGVIIERRYFDVAGMPARTKQGFDRRTYEVDGGGKVLEQTDWGLDGRLGFSRMVFRFNPQGLVTDRTSLDDSGKPVMSVFGFARQSISYDGRGNETSTQLFDAAGRPLKTRLAVSAITPEGQAAKIPLKLGDIVLSYDGQEFTSNAMLSKACRAPGPQARELVILRDGAVLKYPVNPGLLGVSLAYRGEAQDAGSPDSVVENPR